jgi:type IV pilus assembly protein PilB
MTGDFPFYPSPQQLLGFSSILGAERGGVGASPTRENSRLAPPTREKRWGWCPTDPRDSGAVLRAEIGPAGLRELELWDMATARVRLGELLVEAHIVTREQLEDALALQKQDGRRIGTLLVEAGLVSETQVTQILSQQLSVPWVSLYHIDFSRQLLNLVSQELAERYCLVPIFVRKVRGLGQTLYVAMDDPSDEKAQADVSQFAGLPVRAMIAPPSDIRSAIRAYYGAGKDASSLSEAMAEADAERASAERSTRGSSPAPSPSVSPPSPSLTSSPPSAPPLSPPPSFSPAIPPPVDTEALEGPDSGPTIEAHEIPLPPRSKGPRMVTLTLLDGTKVNLPAKAAAKKPRLPSDPPVTEAPTPVGEGLTARDLVAALRAVSHGADASEILGENVRWEALFSALLSLMLKKRMIADWEFVEEYKKV